MRKRWNWTSEQESYLERLYATWHNEFTRKGKKRFNVWNCPIQHPHAYARGYCLISERQWIIRYFRNEFYTGDLSERAIWTKYGRVNGLRENGKVKRRSSEIKDSYESPSLRLSSGLRTHDDVYDWKSWLEAAGIGFLDSGVSRYVFDLGDGNVLKVESGTYGTCNELEINLWKQVVGTKYERFFAPIIAADKNNRWLVMAKADMSQDDLYQDSLVGKLQEAIDNFGLYDIHSYNVGTINGEPVLIDYAW